MILEINFNNNSGAKFKGPCVIFTKTFASIFSAYTT